MRAEQALTESSFRYRTIFQSAAVSLWEEDFTLVKEMLEDLRKKGVKDLRRYLGKHPEFVDEAIAAVKVLDVNEHSLHLFGASDKDELMRSLDDIFVPETKEVFKEELLTLSRGERFFQSETVLKRLDGQRLHALFSIAFPDEPSMSNPAMVSLTDITERKLEEERQLFLAQASAILSSSLDYETTLDNVARLVAGRLGDLCSIDLVDGDKVRRVALAHVDPAKEALFAGMEPMHQAQSDRHPVLGVTRTGQSQLINGIPDETLRDSARDAEHLKALRALNISSAMIVPLAVGARVLGTITIISGESERSYNEADLALAEELSRRAGIAIDNAELYRAREAARQAAQSAADRTTRLQAVTAALSEAVTPSEVANAVAEAAMSALEARSAFIVAMMEGGAFELLAAHGVDSGFLQAWESYSKAAPASIVEAIQLGRAVFASSRDDFVSRFPALASLAIADRSFAGVPLIVEGRAVGSMVLTFGVERVLDTEDREHVLALGRLCAQALERARLYDAAEDAREKAEAASRHQKFLAEASAILASSLDHETTLSSVAQLCVPDLADWCVIDVRNEDGSFDRVAAVHRDAAKVASARRMQDRYPPDYERGIISQVVKTGKAVLYSDVPEEVLADGARDEDHVRLVKELSVKSGIMVPLTARGRTLGILTLLISESERRYGERELKLAEELGQRAGLALDNARLYAAERASRTESEAAQQRLWFIAEANAVLSSSLDFETTLSRLASLAVPWLADCCVAHVFPGEGVEARAAVSHVDAAKEALVKELHARYAPRPNEPHPLMEMIQSHAPVLMEEIDDTALGTIIQDERHREILNELGFRSYMAAPLIARGRLFGAVTFASAKPGRRYSRQDLSLADELARRAALALDNARLYEESQRIQDALRVALEAKDEFLGVMSHELRTPITAIYGNARVLRSRAERLDDDNKNRMMEDIEQESERLFRMVENLLVLSRLELGQEVSTEPVLVQRLIAKLAASFSQRRPSRPIKVNVSEQLAPVFAEPHYLEQILRNLLSNADKYSSAESPIDVDARIMDGEVEISVLDRGAGIAPEEIDLIFDRFYRSDRTAMQAAGLGMGLTVCKRLAEAQAGRIWARPREGGGLEVGITLPLCKEGMDDI